MPVSTSTTYYVTNEWKLPAAPAAQAVFVEESGDPQFDNLVYVSTDAPEVTRAFLACPGMQDAIATFVSAGGSVKIEGACVTIEAADDVDPDVVPDPRSEAWIVSHLIALAPA